jgi:hypothetical protein
MTASGPASPPIAPSGNNHRLRLDILDNYCKQTRNNRNWLQYILH